MRDIDRAARLTTATPLNAIAWQSHQHQEKTLSDLIPIGARNSALPSALTVADPLATGLAPLMRPKLDLRSARHADLTRELAIHPDVRADYFLVSRNAGSTSWENETPDLLSSNEAPTDQESTGPSIICPIIFVGTTVVCSSSTVLLVAIGGASAGEEAPPVTPANGPL
jgi:hypothetical protein